MKITRAQLKKLIKEELKATMDEGLFGKAMDVMGIGGAGGRVWRAYQTMHPGDFTQMMRGRKIKGPPASSSFDPTARVKDPKAVQAAITFIYRATKYGRTADEEINQYLSDLDPAVVKETKEVTDAVATASKLRHEIDPGVKTRASIVRQRILMWENASEKPYVPIGYPAYDR
jgi:hypothetical protein